MEIYIVLLCLLVFVLVPAFGISYIIFHVLLVRNKPEKWSHACSMPEDAEVAAMHKQGTLWCEAHKEQEQIIEIKNDGLKLYGQYYDFGHDRAVIILPGRMESCLYAAYFAKPYEQAGYNVLVIDGRAHGFSEGKYNTVGNKESKDVLAWGKWLHHQANNNHVLLHGICIGAGTSLFAMVDSHCPDYFCGMVAEGMFTSFFHSCKNHMKADKRPIFPFLYIVMLYVRIFCGFNPVTDGPYNRMERLKKPILFLHGKADLFSLPEKMEALFAKCTAPKKLVWFEKGGHSRLRINNTKAYDDAILEFLKTMA